MNAALEDTLLQILLLAGLLVPLFLLVAFKNRKGGRMYTRRMDTPEERERFANDWGPEDRPGRTLPRDEQDDRKAAGVMDGDPDQAPMDGMDFVGRMRRLHGRLQRGEITRREFDLLSRKLAQQAWKDKDSKEQEK